MSSSLPDTIRDLRTRSLGELWGVSVESLYLAVCAVATDTELTHALRPHHTVTVLQTNDERPPRTVADAHDFLLDELGLVTGDRELTDRGRFVLVVEHYGDAIRLIAARQLPRVQQFLREFGSIDSDQLPRSELDTLIRDTEDEVFTVPLLSSLAFVDLYPEGVVLDHSTIANTIGHINRDATQSALAIALITALTTLEDSHHIARVVSTYTDTTVTSTDVNQTTPLDALASFKDTSPNRTPITELADAVDDTRSAILDDIDTFKTALNPEDQTVTRKGTTIDTDNVAETPLSDLAGEFTTTVLDLIATIYAHPTLHSIPLTSLTKAHDIEPYQLYQGISSLPGVNCSLRNDLLLTFNTVPDASQNTDQYDSLRNDLFDALQTRLKWHDTLTDISYQETPSTKADTIESLVRDVNDDVVAPTYFVYTLPDPDALGTERMEQYVDDQPALRRERARLKRWKNQRGNDLRRFTEMTDRLFTRGQERNLEERIVRIMTPYDDDTFSEYTSQLRSLLRDGYELRLLTRHTKKRWEWERLRNNLLGDLEENRENVSIRTYSRYKKYQRITNGTDETDLSEFGIHAKLQTIGHSTEGAVLLGSANFMENSYNWNPECGIYTENSNFVAAAIDFFDHVWEISEADEVDLTSLQEIPRRSFYPSYYT